MKIIVVGLSGMLGHKLFSFLQHQKNYDLYATTTTNFGVVFPRFEILKTKNIFYSEKQDINFFEKIFSKINPDIVINCIAILNESFFNQNPKEYIKINSIFPHEISILSKKYNFKFIHFSTDILYDKTNQLSDESDELCIDSLYASSKFLGEVTYNNSITIRTSIIGHQINGKGGLLEWFLSNNSKTVNGFSNVIYTGLTTTELSKIFHKYIIPNYNHLSGIFNISSNPISKFQLLKTIKKYYNKKIEINDDSSFISNRSLDSTLFNKQTGYLVPEWETMIKEMYNDFKN